LVADRWDALARGGADGRRRDASPRCRFGEGGIARVPFRVTPGLRPVRPVRQPDGKVLVAASNDADHGYSEILLARFTRRGRPDPTFGHRGREHLGRRWNFEPYAVHVQPDGRILVLGGVQRGPPARIRCFLGAACRVRALR